MAETQAYNVTAAHITKTPGVCGGKPCIAGRRIKVRYVYVWHTEVGMSVGQIASEYNLSMAQVYAALTFAYDNLDEIREEIRQEEIFVEEFMRNHPSRIKHLLDDHVTDEEKHA